MELMAVLSGWIYYETDKKTAEAAVEKAMKQMRDTLEKAGINADNVTWRKAELRDETGDTINKAENP